jgi:hypothetical protein
MRERDLLPPDIGGGVSVFEKAAAELHAVVVVVHPDDGGVVEEPEVLGWQAVIGLVGEIEDADVFPAATLWR